MAKQFRGDLNVQRRLSADLAINIPEWITGKDYLVNDVFMESGVLYKVTSPYTSPAVFDAAAVEISETGGGANDRVFVSNTDLVASGLVVAGEPTEAEIKTWNDALVTPNSDVIVRYNATDVEATQATYLFDIDGSGNVTLIQAPSTDGVRESALVDALPVVWTEGIFDAYLELTDAVGNTSRVIDAPINPIVGGIYTIIIYNGKATSNAVNLSAFKDREGVALNSPLLQVGSREIFSFQWDGTDFKQVVDPSRIEYDTNNGIPEGITEGTVLFASNKGYTLTGTATGGIANNGHRINGTLCTTTENVTNADVTIFDDYGAYGLSLTDDTDRTVTASNVSALSLGEIYRVYIVNSGTVITNAFFTSDFRTATHKAMPTIPCDINAQYVVDFVVENDGTNNILTQIGGYEVVSSGGLAQAGILPAAITAQGIYTAEGTNATSPLYASTGSQDRVMITSVAAGVGTVITVPVGESLNGSVDGTYTTQSDGELLLFIDNGVGKWTVQVVGASQQTVLGNAAYIVPYGSADQVGTTAANYAGNERIDLSLGTVKYDPLGAIDTINDEWVCQKDGNYSFVLTLSTLDGGGTSTDNVIYIGDGTIELQTIQPTTDTNAEGNPTISYSDSFTVGDKIDFRIAHPTSENITIKSVTLLITELPSTESILAGMVTPTPLAKMSISSLANAGAVGTNGSFVVLDGSVNPAHTINFDPSGMVTATDEITFPNTGDYSVSLGWRHQTIETINVQLDGVFKFRAYSQNTTNDSPGFHSGIISATAGQVLKLATTAAGAMDNFQLSIIQLPTSTVTVLDGTIPVNDQTTSGYMDIGTMRISNGKNATATTGSVVFPSVYSVAPNVTISVTDGTDARPVVNNVTTTGFDFLVYGSAATTAWNAIGLK